MEISYTNKYMYKQYIYRILQITDAAKYSWKLSKRLFLQRIFRAAFPPIKAACLIPFKAPDQREAFPVLPTHKATGREEDLCLPAACRWTHPWKSSARGGAGGRLEGFLTSGCCYVDPGPAWKSRSYSRTILAKSKPPFGRETPKSSLSLFLASTQRTDCQCSFYFLTPKAQPHISVCRRSSQHLSSPIIYKPDHEKTAL